MSAKSTARKRRVEQTTSQTPSQIPSQITARTQSQPRPAEPPALTSAQAKVVPAFLNKLYNMVSSPTTDDYIRWGDDGCSFIVTDSEQCAHHILPKYFKHNNFSSFVRQLNMYGFHKVPQVSQGSLAADADIEVWQFENENFRKNQPDLLMFVARKRGKPDDDKGELDLNNIINEITTIRRHQLTISSELKHIQKDNQMLWSETLAMRERYQKQQETIDKILNFLASVFSRKNKIDGNSIGMEIRPRKKRRLLTTGTSVADSDECEDEGENSEFDDVIENGAVLNPELRRLSSENVKKLEELKSVGNSGQWMDSPDGTLRARAGESGYSNNELVHQRIYNLPLSQEAPPALVSPPTFDPIRNTLLKNSAATNDLADDIDLLQDNLETLGSSLGIDSWNTPTQESASTPYSGDFGLNWKGTDQDRQTLLSLMGNNNLIGDPSNQAFNAAGLNWWPMGLNTFGNAGATGTGIGPTMPSGPILPLKNTNSIGIPFVKSGMPDGDILPGMSGQDLDIDELLSAEYLSSASVPGTAAQNNDDLDELFSTT